MIAAALKGDLNNVEMEAHPVFGMMVPKTCPNVPDALLNPRATWTLKDAYDKQAKELATLFIKNFDKYASCVAKEILNAAPVAE